MSIILFFIALFCLQTVYNEPLLSIIRYKLIATILSFLSCYHGYEMVFLMCQLV